MKWLLTLWAAALLLAVALSCTSSSPAPKPAPATAQATTPATAPNTESPETVRVKDVTFNGGVKNVTMSNDKRTYILACKPNFDSCLTPAPGKDYLLFNKRTKWKAPGAREYTTLDFLQQFSGKYSGKYQGGVENIALIPSSANTPGSIGMYWLVSWKGN